MDKRLIIIEGADKVGKSTVISLLKESLGAFVISQPNGKGKVAFLRELLKSDTYEFSSFSRQLLHTCSHINDFYEFMSGHDSILVMDRSYISALIYGKADGESDANLELLKKIHNSVYGDLSYNFKIDLFVLCASSMLVKSDNSYYERNLDMQYINSLYKKLDDKNSDYYFGSKEKIHFVDVDSFYSPEAIKDHVLSAINLGDRTKA
ncbi:hypothetical protein TW84_21390 [Vibrio neptunius]|uniref:deoxynucleoside kinase n=1 Tax=Vibrio neptunius TaxID=170651 RepID=UPI0005FA2E65|nr:deoxynucleoside kinase [Vibrio neptunius]KJY85656.1 hypothetical protein TW84_21390 [Vibrio neptunius]